MTKPTEEDVRAARSKLEQVRRNGGSRCEREIARKWYETVKRDREGFEGLLSYVPFRQPGVPISDIYDRFAAKIRRKYGETKSRALSVRRRERLDEENSP